mgnify:CR=1 FL=1
MNVKIGIIPLLTIVFMTLKLCNVIDWSWWWVFSPVIISTVLFIVGFVFQIIGAVLERKGL